MIILEMLDFIIFSGCRWITQKDGADYFVGDFLALGSKMNGVKLNVGGWAT